MRDQGIRISGCFGKVVLKKCDARQGDSKGQIRHTVVRGKSEETALAGNLCSQLNSLFVLEFRNCFHSKLC